MNCFVLYLERLRVIQFFFSLDSPSHLDSDDDHDYDDGSAVTVSLPLKEMEKKEGIGSFSAAIVIFAKGRRVLFN